MLGLGLQRSCILLVFALLHVLRCGADDSSIVELDVIFPRNETYAPDYLMPLVFVVQNPILVSLLHMSIQWALYRIPTDGQYYYDIAEEGIYGNVDPQSWDTSTNTFLVTDFTSATFDIESEWVFRYFVIWSNCTVLYPNSTDDGTADVEEVAYHKQDNTVFFSTKKGSPSPDLVAATSPGVCADTESYIWNVPLEGQLSTVQQPFALKAYCAMLQNTTSKPNPCNVTISAAAAASVTANLTARACATDQSAPLSCPKNASNSSNTSIHHSAAGMPIHQPGRSELILWLPMALIGATFVYLL